MNSILGMSIHVVPDKYRTLGENVPVTPEFRAEINAWMESFFSPTNALRDGEVLICRGSEIYANPRTVEKLKRGLKT